MKTQKRDNLTRTFNHGYQAAVHGKSLSKCPYDEYGSPKRNEWTRGWREGRQDQWSGNTAIAGLHKMAL